MIAIRTLDQSVRELDVQQQNDKAMLTALSHTHSLV